MSSRFTLISHQDVDILSRCNCKRSQINCSRLETTLPGVRLDRDERHR